jgi:tripartite-type tricarboxylate transporter receptor subunit TctC
MQWIRTGAAIKTGVMLARMSGPTTGTFIAAFVSAHVIASAISVVGAQVYPARPVTIVVPFAAGGGNDILARLLAQHMGSALGKQFVISHVSTELLAGMEDLKLAHIPYRGTGAMQGDLVAGHVQMAITAFPPVFGQLRSGLLRPIAVTSETRSSIFRL